MTQTFDLVATCARGTERALKFELKSLGATELKSGPGSVTGKATPDQIADANVGSRVASRVLLGLANFEAPTEDDLVSGLADLPFEEWVPKGATFAVAAHLRSAAVTHTLHAARRVKDAVVDRFRAQGLGRPNVDTKRPQIRLVLFWERNQVALSLDTSGDSLGRRGYRAAGGEAPMRETLAAAILALGHADVARPFCDPCCGTGTLGVEQAFRSLRRAPGLGRRFAVDHWPDDRLGFRAPFRLAQEKAREALRDQLEAPIRLTDWHPEAVALCEESLENAGLRHLITVERVDARKAAIDEDAVFCANLPFGERLGQKRLQLTGFYRTLGERLASLPGRRVLLFTGLEGAEDLLNLGPPKKRWSLYSGPLPAALRRWDIPWAEPPPEGEKSPT